MHLLDEDTEELVDGDDVARFRDSLRTLGIPFHVETSAVPREAAWNAEKHPVVPVSQTQISELIRTAGRTLIF